MISVAERRRRRHLRLEVNLPARYASISGIWGEGVVCSLSESGCFLDAPSDLPILTGEPIRVAIGLQVGTQLDVCRLNGTVVRRNRLRGSGMGISFWNRNGDDLAKLRHYLTASRSRQLAELG